MSGFGWAVHNTCPQNHMQKNARSHPLQGWKSLGVQFNHNIHIQLFNHPSSFGIQCVGEGGERILNQVIFIWWSSGLILP